MAQVIALASLGGNDFTIVPSQLISCTEPEAERLVESGQARRLMESEPTDSQLETMLDLSDRGSQAPSEELPLQDPTDSPNPDQPPATSDTPPEAKPSAPPKRKARKS